MRSEQLKRAKVRQWEGWPVREHCRVDSQPWRWEMLANFWEA